VRITFLEPDQSLEQELRQAGQQRSRRAETTRRAGWCAGCVADRAYLGQQRRSPVYPAQQEAAPLSPERSACIGGHATEPYEQNTQQSPGFGLSFVPQPPHS
jgi:hypothetical protein